MSRKKTAKRVTKQYDNGLSTVIKMEKDFYQTPVKLVSQLNKEINRIKKNEHQVKQALNKLDNQLKKLSQKSHSKVTYKLEKQLLKEKSNLAKQLQNVTGLMQTATEKQEKLLAASKYLNQFEKEWAKGAKKSKVASTKKKGVSVKNSKPKLAVVENTPELEQVTDVEFDEVAKTAS